MGAKGGTSGVSPEQHAENRKAAKERKARNKKKASSAPSYGQPEAVLSEALSEVDSDTAAKEAEIRARVEPVVNEIAKILIEDGGIVAVIRSEEWREHERDRIEPDFGRVVSGLQERFRGGEWVWKSRWEEIATEDGPAEVKRVRMIVLPPRRKNGDMVVPYVGTKHAKAHADYVRRTAPPILTDDDGDEGSYAA